MKKEALIALMLIPMFGWSIEVWVSISDIESGLVFLSFIAMLETIFLLFVAYRYLSYSLKESLEASQ